MTTLREEIDFDLNLIRASMKYDGGVYIENDVQGILDKITTIIDRRINLLKRDCDVNDQITVNEALSELEAVKEEILE